MSVTLRVIFGDTDQMGIVYYANFLRWFEAARGEFCRERGLPYSAIEQAGYGFPVIEAHVRYLKPARYEDVIRVDLTVEEMKRVSIRFAYTVRRGEELLAEGYTVHACVDRKGRPTRFTDEMRRLLGGAVGV